MIEAAAGLAAVVVVATVAAAAWWLTSGRSRWLARAMRRRLLVHLTPEAGGHTIDGRLARVDADGVVLAPASLSDTGVELGGDVYVPRERISFVQAPGDGGDV